MNEFYYDVNDETFCIVDRYPATRTALNALSGAIKRRFTKRQHLI